MSLLASDYDGTLKRNGIIDNKSIEAILDFQRKGNQFAMITGLSIAMIQGELKNIGFLLTMLFAEMLQELSKSICPMRCLMMYRMINKL